MVFAMARARIRVNLPGSEVAPAARGLPGDWLAAGLAASLCLALWATSTKVLVASGAREGGRVLACRYFTGASVVERQYLNTGHATDRRACPAVRVG